MAQDIVSIDRAKVLQKIENHESEVKRLHAFLDSLDSPEFVAERKADNTVSASPIRSGRKPNENPFVEKLRTFIAGQTGDFTHAQVKEYLGNPERRDILAKAMRIIESEGLIQVIESPRGTRPGLYRNLNKYQEQKGQK
jgi:hypothetical protein